MAIRRYYEGIPPANGKIIGSTEDWKLFEGVVTGHGRFQNYKLISTVRRMYKANYFLAVRISNGEMVRSRDMKVLKDKVPELYNWVCKIIKDRDNED